MNDKDIDEAVNSINLRDTIKETIDNEIKRYADTFSDFIYGNSTSRKSRRVRNKKLKKKDKKLCVKYAKAKMLH